jgi:chloramphenicol O-acetyltransferase type A
MQYINIDNWKRKEHFDFFYRADYPQYNICMNIVVTRFLAFVKQRNLSFYYAMIYAVTKVANDCENFRYRIRDGKVVLHDTIHPSFTDITSGSEDDLFKMVTVEMKDSLTAFVDAAKETSTGQKTFFPLDTFIGRDDFVYITSIPWISFTQLSHTISLNKDDAVPRISWGKYYHDGDNTLLPFSIQVHHALVDGVHVGKYVEQLQLFLDSQD